MSTLSRWGREQTSAKAASDRSVLASWRFLKPCSKLKPTPVPMSSTRDSQSRRNPSRDSLCRLALHSGLVARAETMAALQRPRKCVVPGVNEGREPANGVWRQWTTADGRRRSVPPSRKIPTVSSFSIPCGEANRETLLEKSHQFSHISVCGVEFSHQFKLARTTELINNRVLDHGLPRCSLYLMMCGGRSLTNLMSQVIHIVG